MQEWVRLKGLKVVVIFEGRDAAGKGGVIKRITEPLNPRICRVVALGTPTEKERGQWYFQRYVAQLPAEGEIVLFDRSWYNRAGVERVMGFCTDEEYREFLRACPLFEEMLIRSGIILVKYWFSVNDEEQEKRFQERMRNPIKRWKLSAMDVESRQRWVDYSRAKDAMFDADRQQDHAVVRRQCRRQEESAAELHRAICCRRSRTRTSSRWRSNCRPASRTTVQAPRNRASTGCAKSTNGPLCYRRMAPRRRAKHDANAGKAPGDHNDSAPINCPSDFFPPRRSTHSWGWGLAHRIPGRPLVII